MGPRCGLGAVTVMAGLLGGLPVAAVAQEGGAVPETGATPAPTSASPLLSLDQDRLFSESAYGRAVVADLAQKTATAEAESRRIDAQLEAEEKALTQQRATMSADEFAPLAAAFDEKVRKLRAERDAAAEDLRSQETAARNKFFQAAVQVIGDFMVERGAVAIIDKGAIIVSLVSLDVTDDLVKRLDSVLGDGRTP